MIWASRFPKAPISNLGTAGVYIGNPLPNTVFPKLPGLGITFEDGERLGSYLAQGKVVVRLDVLREQHWTRSQNVFGTLRGSRYPEQQVVLGAHLDQWSCGAYDSGSQLAAMLELARALAESPNRPG